MSLMLAELTREQIGRAAPGATAVLPVAAIEQHGPHLPVWVDTMVVEEVARRAAAQAAAQVPVLVCPAVCFGASHHHLIYPGALSLSSDTLIRVLKDLTDALVSSGFRRIFLLNGHGGNEECVRLAARELALRHDVVAGAASYWTLAWQAMVAEGGALELGRVPGHAGGFETALAMAIRPDLVRGFPPQRDAAVAKSEADPNALPLIHRHGSWAEIDGYSDDARAATAPHGQRLLDLITCEVAGALVAFHQRYSARGRSHV